MTTCEMTHNSTDAHYDFLSIITSLFHTKSLLSELIFNEKYLLLRRANRFILSVFPAPFN